MTLKTIPFALALTAAAFSSASPLNLDDPMKKGTSLQSKPMAMNTMNMTSGQFKGIEVNGGMASIYQKDGKFRVKLSDDFKIPGSPAPHFQVVDSQGNVYLLNRLTLVGDKTQRDIVLPKYIKDVAKVQIWCSFAEVNLGEASFAKAVKTH